MENRYIIALEFSGSQVKGAAAVCNSSPYAPLAIPQIEAIAHEDKVACVQYGRVQNIIDADKHASFVLQKLENSPSLQGGKVTAAYVALGGRSLGSMKTSAELVLPLQMEIDNEILHKLFVEATKAIPGDKSFLKVIPRKYTVDNQACQNPVGSLGTRLRGEFTVVTCNPSNRNNIERVLSDRMGLNVIEYVCTPLAIADLTLGEEEKQLGCVLVDIGAQTTTVSIYKDRALYHLATLPLGSNNITLDIAKALSVTNERAETAKCNQGDAMADVTSRPTDDASLINCYVQARLGEIIANVMNQVSVAGLKPSDLRAGIILTGRGAKLRGLEKFVENQTKMKVRLASISSAVTITDPDIVPTDYTSIISIVAHAATRNGDSCMEFPMAQPKQEAAQTAWESAIAEQQPASTPAPNYDPFDSNSDDTDWMVDTEEADRRRAAKQQSEADRAAKAEAERQAKENAAREKAEKAAREAQEKAEKAEAKARQKALKEEQKRNQPSLLDRFKDRFTKMITYNPGENDDIDLDN